MLEMIIEKNHDPEIIFNYETVRDFRSREFLTSTRPLLLFLKEV